MSGIATLTNKYADKIKGYKTKILDTRKTTPLFREYEKQAVRIGGGYNLRMGLGGTISDRHAEGQPYRFLWRGIEQAHTENQRVPCGQQPQPKNRDRDP